MENCPGCTAVVDLENWDDPDQNQRLCIRTLIEQKSKECALCAVLLQTIACLKGCDINWLDPDEVIDAQGRLPQLDLYIPNANVHLIDGGSKSPWMRLSQWVNLCSPPGQPKLHDAIDMSRLFPSNFLSEANVSLFLSWIQDCNTQHPACRIAQVRCLPRRVLDVRQLDESLDARLVETKQHVGEYAALSYCWGVKGTPSIATTRSTLASRKSRIRWVELPAAFKDAITVTRSMKLDYLWIDMLCIIQDDTEDWMEQSKAMGSIYNSSSITICPVQSESIWAGFLRERTPTFLGEYNQGSTQVFLRAAIAHEWMPAPSGWKDRYTLGIAGRYAALERGWCVQERILSPRLLYFTDQEVVFCCRQSQKCECGQVSDEKQEHLAWLANDSKHFTPAEQGQKSYEQIWQDLVEDYTTKSLTYATDRLIALGGIASFFYKVHPQRYIAGLWDDTHLAYSLAWRVNRRFDPPHRPSAYVAPSFSWASVNASVKFFAQPEYFNRKQAVSCLSGTRFDIMLSSENPFGALAAGTLHITGPTFSVIVGAKPQTESWSPSPISYDTRTWINTFVFHEDGKRWTTAAWDTVEDAEMPDGTPLLFIALLEYMEDDTQADFAEPFEGVDRQNARLVYVGLLLVPSGNSSESWRRVGIVDTLPENWFSEEEEVAEESSRPSTPTITNNYRAKDPQYNEREVRIE